MSSVILKGGARASELFFDVLNKAREVHPRDLAVPIVQRVQRPVAEHAAGADVVGPLREEGHVADAVLHLGGAVEHRGEVDTAHEGRDEQDRDEPGSGRSGGRSRIRGCARRILLTARCSTGNVFPA